MKKLVCIIFILSVLDSILTAVSFQDKKQNMVVNSLSSWRITKTKEQIYKFVGSGSPFLANWKNQGIKISAKNIDGLLSRQSDNSFDLSSCTVKGDVHFNYAKQQSDFMRTASITCPELDYDQKNLKIAAKGPVELISTPKDNVRLLKINCSQATFNLYPNNKKEHSSIKSGKLLGPVKVKIQANISAQKPGVTTPTTYFDASADTLEFDFDKNNLVLRGNVLILGHDESHYGEIEANTATIIYNESFEIQEMDFQGDSGRTLAKQKKGTP